MVELMALFPSRLSALVAILGTAPLARIRSMTRRIYLSYSWEGFSDHQVSILTKTTDGLHVRSSQSSGDSPLLQDLGSARSGERIAATLKPPRTARLFREKESL